MRSFKRILCSVLAFLLVVGVLSLGFMEVYFRTEYDFFQDGSDREALAGSLDLLICGASHAYRAFKPTVIDPVWGTSGYNISGAMMTMGGRYEMLRTELSRNPVKTVVFEVSYNTMTRNRAKEGTEGDLYVLARLSGFFNRIGFYFRGFLPQEYLSVYHKFVTEGMEATFDLLRGRTADAGQRSRGYVPTGPRTIEIDTNYADIYHTKELSVTVDPYNEKYLDQILTLCRDSGVEVILVTTPLTKAQLCRYGNYQHFYEQYRELAEKWDLRYYDFNLFKEKDAMFPDQTLFYDNLHLNDEGAEAFSHLFAELIARERNGEDLSDLFYASYPEMEQHVFGFQSPESSSAD